MSAQDDAAAGGEEPPDAGAAVTRAGTADAGIPAPPASASCDRAARLADWVTEELLQRLYAARQDLAEAAESDADADGDGRAEGLRGDLLAMIRRLREIAELLRHEPVGPASPTVDLLAGQVVVECGEAARLLGIELPPTPFEGSPPAGT
jgi:hypothetical protein